MPLDFPASPSNGATYTGPNGVVWIWDGTKWTVGTQSGAYLPLSGGILTGDISTSGNITINETVATSEPVLALQHPNNNWAIGVANSAAGGLAGAYYVTDVSNAAVRFAIIEGGAAPAVTIGATGNLGAGTTVPFGRMHLTGPGQATTAINTTGNLPNSLFLGDNTSAVGSGGMIVFGAGADVWRFAAIKGFAVDGSNNSRGEIAFSTRRGSADATLTEAMRLTAGGALYAGNMLYPTAGAPGNIQAGTMFGSTLASSQLLTFNCYFNGGGSFYQDSAVPSGYASWINSDPNGGSWSISMSTTQVANGQTITSGMGRLYVFNNGTCQNTTGTWSAISDASTKTNIQPYDRGLEAVMALEPVSFQYTDKNPLGDDGGVTRFGLIADQVKPHIPEVVGRYVHTPEKEGVKGEPVEFATLDPGMLIYACINAIKELAAEVQMLKGAAK